MDFNKLKQYLELRKEPTYRFAQIASEVASGRVLEFDEIFTISKELRQDLAKKFKISSVKEVEVQISRGKKAYKALLELVDGKLIETVLLNPSANLWSVCLSSQVGCAMGCAFCATGKQGLKRNLSSEEIADQILFWRQYIQHHSLRHRINNVVYMGMGEPFNNQVNVFESIKWLTDPQLYGLGQRHISVSTCGIVPGIDDFAQKFPQVNLAISLHAASDSLRSKLMPVANMYSLEQLMYALNKYLEITNRQIFFEYILLSGVNDSDGQAIELGNLMKNYFGDKLHLIHINLIPFNFTGGEFSGSTQARMDKFEAILKQFHITSSIRKSLGQDIAGACGQLAGSARPISNSV